MPVDILGGALAGLGDVPQKRKKLLQTMGKAAEDAKKEPDVASNEIKARYKIEILFGKDRSISSLNYSTGMLLMWESGKRFHGGGDEKMYWCGYDDCGKPITVDNFGYYHCVCPKCKRELFLDPGARELHVKHLRDMNKPINGLDKLPVIVGERLFKLSPPKIADLLEKTWYQLGCNADIYLKYHPTDIRTSAMGSEEDLANMRNSRAKMIYPLKNILKDTAAGASLNKRLLAMVTA